MRTIQIFCAYFENYNYDSDTPYYKIKGEHVFEMDVEFNDLMYRENELRAVINDMIVKRTNPNGSPSACKYIITSIELKPETDNLGSLNMKQLTKAYFKGEDYPNHLQTNKINPGLCSPAANEYLMERCRTHHNFRDQAIDYTDIKNCM